MNNRPVFSVVIDNYNYGCYIDEAIESVFNQTLPQSDIEIIVVDDGSTDDSRERLKKYEGKIKCIFKENGGQASALNAGVSDAKGEIIAFLDSDDYWHPVKLQRVFEEFEKSESVDFVYHFMNVIDKNRKVVDRYIYPLPLSGGETVSGKYLNRYLGGNLPWFSPTSGMTIRAECLRNAFPIPEDFRIGADLYLHYILPFYMRGLALIQRPLGYYRMHEANLSGGNLVSAEKMSREIGIMLHIENQVERHARKLGYDCGLLKRRIDSMVNVYGILLDNAEGRKLRALTKAISFDTRFPGDSVVFRLWKKAVLLCTSVCPPIVYLWLQRTYRRMLHVMGRF